MPDAKTLFNEPTRYLIGLIGEPGSGKTRQALSFPACYVICCDPEGIQILKEPRNNHIADNLIWYEYFATEVKSDAKALFKQTSNPEERTSLYGVLAHIKQLAKDGQIRTVILDGLSYMCDLFGLKAAIDQPGNTESDRWAYYRQLKNDMTWFLKSNLFTLTRYGLNVIFTAHIQREADEQQKKQANTEVDIAPRLEGGIRQAIAGMPRAMLYLDYEAKTEIKNGQAVSRIVYRAYCQRVKIAHMGLVPAKNTYNLPPVVNLTDKWLSEVIEAAMGNKATTTATK